MTLERDAFWEIAVNFPDSIVSYRSKLCRENITKFIMN